MRACSILLLEVKLRYRCQSNQFYLYGEAWSLRMLLYSYCIVNCMGNLLPYCTSQTCRMIWSCDFGSRSADFVFWYFPFYLGEIFGGVVKPLLTLTLVIIFPPPLHVPTGWIFPIQSHTCSTKIDNNPTVESKELELSGTEWYYPLS